MASKVFVVEDTKHNLTRALEFGDVELMETEDFPIFRDGRPTLERVTRVLSTFDPAQDYLLLVGDPILIGLSFAVLGKAGHKNIRVLKWDSQSRRYVPVTVPLI